jgi:hypothetical protein
MLVHQVCFPVFFRDLPTMDITLRAPLIERQIKLLEEVHDKFKFHCKMAQETRGTFKCLEMKFREMILLGLKLSEILDQVIPTFCPFFFCH